MVKFNYWIAFLFMIAPAVVRAQEMELEKFVSKNCAAFVVIEKPDVFLSSIKNFRLFENPKLARAWEILQNEEHPLLDAEGVNQLGDQWEKFNACLSKLDEVSLVLHPIEGVRNAIYADAFNWRQPSIPKFSVVLVGDQEVTDEIEKTLFASRSSILQFATSPTSDRGLPPPNTDKAKRDGPDSEVDETPEIYDDYDLDSGFRANRWDITADFFKAALKSLVVKKTRGGLIVSNDATSADGLAARLTNSSGKKFRSLSDHRSYKTVQKLLEGRSESSGVRGFFVPENLPELGAQMVTNSLPFEPKSLRAGGVFISLDTANATIETQEANFEPLVEWKFVLTVARPAETYGKIIQSFKELKAPPAIALPITRCDAFGFDSRLRNEAFEETIDRHQQQRKNKITGNRNPKIESFEDGDSAGDDSENYNDFYDAELYSVVGQFKEFDPSTVAGFSDARMVFEIADVDTGEGREMEIYAVDEFEKMEAFFLQRVQQENQHLDVDRHFGEVENEYGRMFARDLAAVRSIVREFDEGLADDDPLPSGIMATEPEFFFNEQWMICTDHVTMRNVLRELYEQPLTPSKFSQILQLAKKRNDNRKPVKIRYRSVSRRGPQYNSIERLHIMDKFAQPSQEEQMWEVLSSEPDEFGLRNVIESEYDAVVAISQLVSDVMEETFDSSINLYTVEDYSLRVFGQVYSKVEK